MILLDLNFKLLSSAVVCDFERIFKFLGILVAIEKLILCDFKKLEGIFFTCGENHIAKVAVSICDWIISYLLNKQEIWMIKLSEEAILHD